MRGGWIAIACTVGCAAGERPEPLPVPQIARGLVPAPPMPAYGGMHRTGACAIAFAPADPIEAGRRTNAIAARLPAGAIVELTALGDRARRVAIGIDRARVRERDVARIARAFVRDSADVWGANAGAISVRGQIEKDDRGRWSIELEAGTARAAWDPDDVLIVVRVDGKRGRLEAGLVREPLPAAPLCDGPEPAFDRDRMRDVVIAASRTRGRPGLADDDVGDPEPFVLAEGATVRRVTAVPFGRRLGAYAHAPDRDTTFAAMEGIALVDPDTGEVVGGLPPPYRGGVDPYYSPSSDAERVLDDH